MSGREYEGPAIDGTVQYISERPAALGGDDGETVDATDSADGEMEVEAVPELGDADSEDRAGVHRPDTMGQTDLDDWGCST